MFVLKNKKMGFSLCRLGHTPGGGTWGCLWVIFFQTWSCAYQIEGDDEQNGEQVKCSPYGQSCSFRFSFTPIVRLWHDACALDSMERNAYIRACELSQHRIQFDY